MLDSTSTVQEICEAANGFRFKAEGRVHVCEDQEGRCVGESLSWLWWRSHIWALSLFTILLFLYSWPCYASSSKPKPTLCPPPFMFFPSSRPERVSFTPGRGGEWTQDFAVSKCNNDDEAAVAGSEIFNRLTWPEGLCVSHSNEAGVVNFSLWEETQTQMRNQNNISWRVG